MVVREKNALQQLLGAFVDVFKEELGTITPGKAKLVVTASATLKFPRPVPYTLRPLVEQELDRLEQAGVLDHVDHSDWAAPIVTVRKRDGLVRICGGYKVTVNPVLDINQHPLPCPEDLFDISLHWSCLTLTIRSCWTKTLAIISLLIHIVGCIIMHAYHLEWHPRYQISRRLWTSYSQD